MKNHEERSKPTYEDSFSAQRKSSMSQLFGEKTNSGNKNHLEYSKGENYDNTFKGYMLVIESENVEPAIFFSTFPLLE